ncbi:MAG: hypothetical protein HC806_06700 [Anaerolineae bacterium]|nr:hypothetical protein [Anaerolineae bacterium]
MLTLLEETPASAIPHLILDFLATFYDESVSAAESYRLLSVAIGHLNRLRKFAPLIISVHPARFTNPIGRGWLKPCSKSPTTFSSGKHPGLTHLRGCCSRRGLFHGPNPPNH